MPSLILEHINKTDDRRKDEAEDWIAKLESRFEIEKRKYINIEVVLFRLRQSAPPGCANLILYKFIKENQNERTTVETKYGSKNLRKIR